MRSKAIRNYESGLEDEIVQFVLHLLAIGLSIAGSRCYCWSALPGHDEVKQGEGACSTSCMSCLAISDYSAF
jgi:hypothetical protein